MCSCNTAELLPLLLGQLLLVAAETVTVAVAPTLVASRCSCCLWLRGFLIAQTLYQ